MQVKIERIGNRDANLDVTSCSHINIRAWVRESKYLETDFGAFGMVIRCYRLVVK